MSYNQSASIKSNKSYLLVNFIYKTRQQYSFTSHSSLTIVVLITTVVHLVLSSWIGARWWNSPTLAKLIDFGTVRLAILTIWTVWAFSIDSTAPIASTAPVAPTASVASTTFPPRVIYVENSLIANITQRPVKQFQSSIVNNLKHIHYLLLYNYYLTAMQYKYIIYNNMKIQSRPLQVLSLIT